MSGRPQTLMETRQEILLTVLSETRRHVLIEHDGKYENMKEARTLIHSDNENKNGNAYY